MVRPRFWLLGCLTLALLTAGVWGRWLAPSPVDARTVAALACGVERWPVKTFTDDAASEVTFRHGNTTVYSLRRRGKGYSMFGERWKPVELKTYRVRADLQEGAIERDGDIHLVIAEPGRPRLRMIAEFPKSSCVRSAPPVRRRQMAAARRAFQRACGRPSSSRFDALTGSATIIGVGFFDFIHGQKGVAPNGIELHPVLRFSSRSCLQFPG